MNTSYSKCSQTMLYYVLYNGETYCIEIDDLDATVEDLKFSFIDELYEDLAYITEDFTINASYEDQPLDDNDFLKELPIAPNDGNEKIIIDPMTIKDKNKIYTYITLSNICMIKCYLYF